MKNLLSASFFFLYCASSIAADAVPEVRNTDIEYSSPKAAYEALRIKQGVAFSKDDSGWTVAFDKEKAVIWSFAPASEPSFPIVVKRTVLENAGHLFIKMDVMCGGKKEACDNVVRKYTEINEQISRKSQKKAGGSEQ